MAFLKFVSDALQSLEEYKSKDEIVFGEIIRVFVKKGHPMIRFNAAEGRQSARFLLDGPVLFALSVTFDKKIGGHGVLDLTAEVRNKLADPDDMIAMFKTDLSNIAKIPLLGQIKINHEYNTIYARSTSVKNISSYLVGKGVVNSSALERDLDEIIARLEAELKRFKKV